MYTVTLQTATRLPSFVVTLIFVVPSFFRHDYAARDLRYRRIVARPGCSPLSYASAGDNSSGEHFRLTDSEFSLRRAEPDARHALVFFLAVKCPCAVLVLYRQNAVADGYSVAVPVALSVAYPPPVDDFV